jgi:hypothetical protein
MRLDRTILFVLLLAFAGCQVSSPIVPAGKDSYLVSSHVGGCVSCSAAVKSLKAANDFCAKQGKAVIVRNTDGTTNPFGYNTANETVFSCVSPDDPEYARPTLNLMSSPVSATASPGDGRGSTAAAAQVVQQLGKAMQDAPLIPYKQKCLSFGFTEGTPEFAQCVQRQYNAAQPAQPVGADFEPPLQCQTSNNGGVTQTNCFGGNLGPQPVQCQSYNNGGVVNTVCR